MAKRKLQRLQISLLVPRPQDQYRVHTYLRPYPCPRLEIVLSPSVFATNIILHDLRLVVWVEQPPSMAFLPQSCLSSITTYFAFTDTTGGLTSPHNSISCHSTTLLFPGYCLMSVGYIHLFVSNSSLACKLTSIKPVTILGIMVLFHKSSQAEIILLNKMLKGN